MDSAYPKTLKDLNDEDRDLAFDQPTETPGNFAIPYLSEIWSKLTKLW